MPPVDMEATRTSSPLAASGSEQSFEHLAGELELSGEEQEDQGDVSRPPSCFVSMCQVSSKLDWKILRLK